MGGLFFAPGGNQGSGGRTPLSLMTRVSPARRTVSPLGMSTSPPPLDEVVNQGDLDDAARMMAILAALLGCQGVEEYRVLLPAALLLVRVLPDWSFGAFLIAELATCAVSLALYGKLRREKIDTIGTASGGL